MSGFNVRESIAAAIGAEIDAALGQADTPLNLYELHQRAPSSAAISDIRAVVAARCREQQLTRSVRAGVPIYHLPDPPPSAAALAKAAAPKRDKLGRNSRPAKNGRSRRIQCVLEDRQRWLGVAAMTAELGEDASKVENTLAYLAGASRGKLIKRIGDDGVHREYGLPAWGEPPPDAPAPARDAPEDTPADAPEDTAPPVPVRWPLADAQPRPRFGLWSDGRLSIENADGRLELDPAACQALVEYLVAVRGQIGVLFDTHFATEPDA